MRGGEEGSIWDIWECMLMKRVNCRIPEEKGEGKGPYEAFT